MPLLLNADLAYKRHLLVCASGSSVGCRGGSRGGLVGGSLSTPTPPGVPPVPNSYSEAPHVGAQPWKTGERPLAEQVSLGSEKPGRWQPS